MASEYIRVADEGHRLGDQRSPALPDLFWVPLDGARLLELLVEERDGRTLDHATLETI